MRIASLTLLLMIYTASISAQRIKTTLTQSWRDSAWHDSLQETYAYDSRGLLSTRTGQRWDAATGAWVNSRKETYDYYADSTQRLQTTQVWDADSKAWQNYSMVTWAYSSPDYDESQLSLKWVNGSWQNVQQLLYTYNKKRFPVKCLWLKWNPGAGQWYTFWRSNTSWDSRGKPDHQFSQEWDTLRHRWSKDREDKVHWRYDKSGRPLGSDDIFHINNHWIKNINAVYSYDELGHKIAMTCTNWDARTQKWVAPWHEDYTNNSDGSVHYMTSTRWNRGGELESKVMVKYTYF